MIQRKSNKSEAKVIFVLVCVWGVAGLCRLTMGQLCTQRKLAHRTCHLCSGVAGLCRFSIGLLCSQRIYCISTIRHTQYHTRPSIHQQIHTQSHKRTIWDTFCDDHPLSGSLPSCKWRILFGINERSYLMISEIFPDLRKKINFPLSSRGMGCFLSVCGYTSGRSWCATPLKRPPPSGPTPPRLRNRSERLTTYVHTPIQLYYHTITLIDLL
jgi:hypothetical protein